MFPGSVKTLPVRPQGLNGIAGGRVISAALAQGWVVGWVVGWLLVGWVVGWCIPPATVSAVSIGVI